MTYSRASIPLFTIFLLVIALYMAYLITAKNIFNIPFLRNSPATNVSVEAENPAGDTQHPMHNYSFDDAENSTTLPTKTTTKITPSVTEKTNASDKTTDAAPGASNEVADTVRETTSGSTTLTIATAQTQNPQLAHDYELKLLWLKYSAKVPRLYSRPLNSSTEEKLGHIGRIAMELDFLYQEDRGSWVKRVADVKTELIAMSVDGEREAARTLSFQYFRPPLYKIVDSLTWAMIANAMAPNDYYLYICAEDFTSCSEGVFSQASDQAKNYSAFYGFRGK